MSKYFWFCLMMSFFLCFNVSARTPIRKAFFDAYPTATGSVLDDLPSDSGHCGVCHYDFAGGGTRNPYGLAVEATPDRDLTDILSLGGLDSDGDGFSNDAEITDGSYQNTPTFSGLSPAHMANVVNIPISEIQDYLVPSIGVDTTPPEVTVIDPDGGEVLIANLSTSINWTASDISGVAGVDIYLSLDGGVSYKPLAIGIGNTGTYTWFPANRPTINALVKIEATDNAFNKSHDTSNAEFTIASPAGGRVPTTLRDFDMPGSQPFEAGTLNDPEACAVCHGNYDESVEPYFNWQGSMMAHASIDPIFMANMVIANQDAPDSGDLCIRCHFPRGWLRGRSVPTDASAILETDKSGVSCDLCHRLVDPINDPQNPVEDIAILASLSSPASEFGNGMYTVDPVGGRRGPFVDAVTGHPILVSPFHREAALCGTCHDVSNTAFEKDENGNYVPNTFDSAAQDFSANKLLPVERTYSEWLNSAYNTPTGVYAPQFGGNKDFVATCQDCHMRDVTGQGCNLDSAPVRDDLPLHDLTGGSTWLPSLLSALNPGKVNEAAIQAGIERARSLLQKAASLTVFQDNGKLVTRVTNNTGHKLPTGYPEGRRIWINVKFFDDSLSLISESGAYDPSTGQLDHDLEVKIYEVEPAIDDIVSSVTGLPTGPSFHFVLNSTVAKDNRIPPQGFTNSAFEEFGGKPVGYAYADGQFWDDTYYSIPVEAASAKVYIYYQSTSKEFIEFLRDENTTDSQGQDLYDLWNDNGKCPPEEIALSTVSISSPPLADFDLDWDVDQDDLSTFISAWLSSEGQGNWNPDCNLDASDTKIDLNDFAIFAQYWAIGL